MSITKPLFPSVYNKAPVSRPSNLKFTRTRSYCQIFPIWPESAVWNTVCHFIFLSFYENLIHGPPKPRPHYTRYIYDTACTSSSWCSRFLHVKNNSSFKKHWKGLIYRIAHDLTSWKSFLSYGIFIYPIAQLIQNKAYFSIDLLKALTMHEHVIFIYIVGSHFLELDSKYQFSHVLVCKLHET